MEQESESIGYRFTRLSHQDLVLSLIYIGSNVYVSRIKTLLILKL